MAQKKSKKRKESLAGEVAGSSGTPHNNYFQKQWSNIKVARSFFEEYLPESVKRIMDWSKLRLAPGDFVQKALQNRKSDILYETRFKDRKGFLFLHLEHQCATKSVCFL